MLQRHRDDIERMVAIPHDHRQGCGVRFDRDLEPLLIGRGEPESHRPILFQPLVPKVRMFRERLTRLAFQGRRDLFDGDYQLRTPN